MSNSKGAHGQTKGGSGFRPLGDKEKAEQRYEGNAIDETFGFHNYSEGPGQLGWLLNYIQIVSWNGSIIDLFLLNVMCLFSDVVVFLCTCSRNPMRRVLKRAE